MFYTVQIFLKWELKIISKNNKTGGGVSNLFFSKKIGEGEGWVPPGP